MGDLTIDGTGSIVIQVSNSANSLVTVAGNLSIQPGAILVFDALSGYSKPNNNFEFLTATTISGVFSQVTSNSRLIQPTLTYSGGQIGATLKLTDFANIVDNNNNALSVGEALTQLLNQGNPQATAILSNLLGLARDQDIQDALNQMQPALYKGLTISQENNAVKVQDTLGYRFQQELDEVYCYQIKSSKTERQGTVSCEKEKRDIHLWVDGFGDILKQNSTTFAGSPQLGYQTKSGGVSLGLDGRFAEYFYAGALGAYTDSSTHWNNSAGKGTIQTGYGGLYLSAISDMFYGNLSVIGAGAIIRDIVISASQELM